MVAKIFLLFLICWFLWKQQVGVLLTLHASSTALYRFVYFFVQKLFEFLFSWWPIIELFRTEAGNVREWRFRSGLDIFVWCWNQIHVFFCGNVCCYFVAAL